MEDYYPFWFT